MIIHPIAPVFDRNSQILILGSFPSVKSRRDGFYYAHPKNRFWKLISDICGEDIPNGIEERKALLLKHGIALWDVICSCEIKGSSDASITDVIPNDIRKITRVCKIKKVFLNGKTALKYYLKYIAEDSETGSECLPSTSPANASVSYQRLFEIWDGALKSYIR